MADIYDQHDAAFAKVSAFVILDQGEQVATIAIKFPRDGAGRLYAYVHWIGLEMVRGFANGYGYDKRSAACCDAARRLANHKPRDDREIVRKNERMAAFHEALRARDGVEWTRKLEDAGFQVLQAV